MDGPKQEVTNRAPGALVLRRCLLILAFFAAQASYLQARVDLAPCKNNFSPEQQIQLGGKAKQEIYRRMPVLPDSSPVAKYIQQLGEKLAAHAPGRKWPYNFHVADVADINAFALPGGSIFVNLGTIQAAGTEAQLAGVMAHEIAHVVLQHSVCNAEKEQRVGLLAGLGQLAAGAILGGTAGALAQEGIGLTANLGFLKMSRTAEQQADREGVQILYDAGYDPRGMAQFFETIQAKYGKGGSQFLSDHPNPGNRTEYVDKEIASFPPRAHSIVTTPQFKRIRALVAKMHAYTAREVASGVWRKQSPNGTVASGVNQAVETGSIAPDLNTSGPWKTFRGAGYSIQVPGNWRAYGNEIATMLGPPGGVVRSAESGAASVIYGMLTDRYQTRIGSNAAFHALVSEIARDNPGISPGPEQGIAANGVVGRSVQSNNPSANNGKGEHDWIVAFPQPDGSLRYFVFVAPSPDFEKLRPTFQKILQSLTIRG